MRRFIFYLLEVLTLFLLLTGSQALVGAEETCDYVWHDHYKVNYRVRHKHKICGGLNSHYKDDPLSKMQLRNPEFEEAIKDKEDVETTAPEEVTTTEKDKQTIDKSKDFLYTRDRAELYLL